MPGLDAGGPGGDHGFAAFGRVIEGMDVVKQIFEAPMSATKGEGAMKGQMLDPPIKIVKVTRLNPLPAPAAKPGRKRRRDARRFVGPFRAEHQRQRFVALGQLSVSRGRSRMLGGFAHRAFVKLAVGEVAGKGFVGHIAETRDP